MNIFDTTSNGGIPFVWDDFRFEQDAVRESFKGIIDSFGAAADEGYILSGCEQTVNAPNIDIAAGFIVLEGEIYRVAAHSILQAVTNTHFWKLSETNDPAGLKTLESAGTANTYKIRLANVVDEIPSGLYTPINAPTLAAKITDLISPDIGGWTKISLTGALNVVQNTGDLGTGSDATPAAAPTGGFLKYNVIGKTINLIWDFNLTTTTYAVSPASTIVINSLPFTFSADEEAGACSLKNNSFIEGLSGQGQVIHTPSTNKLVFRMPTIGGGIGSLNRKYEFATAPIKNVVATVDVSSQHLWNLSGSATFELA